MKNNLLRYILASISLFNAAACHKASGDSNPGTDFATLETQVITDFTNDVALNEYSTLSNSGISLQAAITTLNATPTDANLAAAQLAWKGMRTSWEQCEGFLFGPVEDHDYDPNTDTWPTDYNQMDSLLASTNPLASDDIKSLPQSLRGYHPIEYMIFGKGGSRTAAQLTDRERKYMVALTNDVLYNNVQALYNDWTQAPTDFQAQVLSAGTGSTQFTSKQELFLNIVSGMSDICGEVGDSKMKEPFLARDSTSTESPYSSNTLVDFKNNIIGLRNVYLGLNGGKGISDLVSAKNANLDNQITTAIQTAISSFSNITDRYEIAIYEQRTQVQQTMDLLAALQTLLDNDLKAYVTANVKD